MRHSGYYIILLLLTALSVSSYADNRQARKLIRKGNALYRADKRQEAQVDYLKAYRADSTDARVQYNLATSMFPQDYKLVQKERCDTMAMMFERAAQAETNPLRKAKAYHNEGVAYQGVKDFGKAIEAYKNALRCNPNDDESRYNLVLCQRQLKNQGGGNNNQQQDKQDKQDQQDKQQQQQQQKKQKKQDQQQQQQEPPMSKENAEQLLNAAMQREKETQKRMKEAQQQPQRRRIEKNW
ncbi:tetratricopeptide repeat protein [Prevotella communis]|uniref:Tetratricopeptide repeat-containing protein n=1 Tax=Prevotella communis TaxID=2913614 RepID=A0A1H0JRV1_9BACT|nr:tetratricopeptide repeat protein [Prevotella communis]UKK57995.1 tetratricopeptide repeat protein [Prevotella communis]UKK68659.1 tetratricopeptide repeat protein [Prevotella communis]UKK69206.1 tetratricopeptide repeat protein [Prevotella communis]SDG99236.1 Tetratricopeptide repeat-containing protein [Prevotella communis]SDO46259.1 Tetratricopeptide repeat-containing protein [Prevotella communis]